MTEATQKSLAWKGSGELPSFRAYGFNALRSLPQLRELGEQMLFEMRVVGSVLPFKTNNYVVEQLIDWDGIPDDPIFRLTFPHRAMLLPHQFEAMARMLRENAPPLERKRLAAEIRRELNPNPAGQKQLNVPIFRGRPVTGVQHKYRETALLFPREGQTCHAYCTYCFRWPQLTGDMELRFAIRSMDRVIGYLHECPEVTDVLITGGDPMTMKAALLREYVSALTAARLPRLQTIRIGTRMLSYWPYRVLSDEDSDELIDVLKSVVRRGYHLALMAHVNHGRELRTEAAERAVARLRGIGCEIRTQAPVVRHVNDDAGVWADLVREQVRLGMIPYYMFIARDTGAKHYFEIPLVRALQIYREAVRQLSGLGRTMRGPSMSATLGKIEVLDVTEVGGEKVFALRFLQARDPAWVGRVFFARYDDTATWIDDLQPAFGAGKFFFQQ